MAQKVAFFAPIESRTRHPRPSIQKLIAQASKPWGPSCAECTPYPRYSLAAVNIKA